MATYTWEPIPEGETPEWGEWIKMSDAADDCGMRLFVGVDPASNHWVTTHEGTPELWWAPLRWAPSGWLRRVEKPHRWDRWMSFDMNDGWMSTFSRKPDNWDSAGPCALVHIYCDTDGELHIEQVND